MGYELTIETVVLIIICVVMLAILVWIINLGNGIKRDESVVEKRIESMERTMMAQLNQSRQEAQMQFSSQREELNSQLARMMKVLSSDVSRMGDIQQTNLKNMSLQLVEMVKFNQTKLDEMRNTMDQNIKSMSQENAKRLDEMRNTVDERLQSTLEKRLDQSFQLVSNRLEQVYKGLGEMQSLAEGVGDLKRVLTNVKTRGTWGEIQLGALLEQMLAPSQYQSNVAVKPNRLERVEFAICLPGKEEDGKYVYLPIDAKFPQEDYIRLIDASEAADANLVVIEGKKLETTIKNQAKLIMEKYIHPPHTTDFAIMYLPTEGLYAEVAKRSGLIELLQHDYRVSVAGPSTLTALLNSLQMGFRTLAIEKHSSKVWQLLGVCKKEFSEYEQILEKTKKKLQEAVNTMDTAARKTRRIDRKLRAVQIDGEFEVTQERETDEPLEF